MFQPVDEARSAWLGGKLPAKKIGADWVTQQWLRFLDEMPALSAAQLAELDKAFGLSKTPNAEIAHSWFKLVIVNDYRPGFPRLEEYLTTIGRRKLIEPLYTGLMKTSGGDRSGQARLDQGASRLPSGNRQGDRSHRRAQGSSQRMSAESTVSEWMRIMLEEIARKRAEEDEMRAEEQRRREARGRAGGAERALDLKTVVLQFAQFTDD